ncbi:MAG: type I-MYXAN CRISPR-associated protein Cmx8 [Cyanobacteria bacterium P01_F01_bin.143]
MTEIKLKYNLAELPSAQHRAGLAGLVLMTRELRQQPWFDERDNPVVEFIEIKEYSATIKLNLEGLKSLFDFAYKAKIEIRWTTKKDKKRNYQEDEIRTGEKKILVGKKKTEKIKLITEYQYKVVVPHGAFLPIWDKSSDKLWIKLWRDMLWNIIRGVPATRNSFNNRCDGNVYYQDAEKLWQELKTPDKQVGQSGNYFLGAMASNADNIPTKDIVKYQFLLHFWVFVAQVYCPMVLDKDGKRQFAGYTIAVPDVANLRNFCKVFPKVLQARDTNKFGYLPSASVIDLPEESALDLTRLLLSDRVAQEIGSQQIRRLILGVEAIYAEKVGNSVKIRSVNYLEPVKEQRDRYAQIRQVYWCPWFRKQRLINLLNSQPESNLPNAPLKEIPGWIGFDVVLSRIPRKWLLDPYFSHDARELFNIEGEIKMKKDVRKEADIVYKVCQSYILGKLASKYNIEWSKKKKKYIDTKTKQIISDQDNGDKYKKKIANEAFLAVRSRTEEQAFISYFADTLQPLIRKEEFADFANKLFNQTSEIRALTLLALASQFPITKKSEDNIDSQSKAA